LKNIVFDLGNVLFKFDPDEILDGLFNDSHTKEKLKQSVFKTTIWRELDRGSLSLFQAKKIFIDKNPDLKDEIEILLDNWKNFLHPIDENMKLLPELKKNNRLYILSNFHEEAFNYITNKYSFFELFDGMVVSYKVKLIKPERKIYEILLSRYSLIPQDTIFVDDTEENIKAAQELGIKGLLYKSELSLEDLFKLEKVL
jgi:putative hydrolase of the HAD superfamily